jgi:hypothetical protein
MRIGESIIEPITGYKARVIGFRSGQPLGRNAEGRLFVGRSPCGAKRKPYLVRVVEDGEALSEWLEAEGLKGGRLRIVSDDPVFAGAVVSRDEVEMRE